MQNKNDISYGVIPFYNDGEEWQVFLIYQYGSTGDIFWTFPKGHPEPDEEPEAAAMRELTEETGLVLAALVDDITVSQSYSFQHDDLLINKHVTYYVGVVEQPDCTLQADEVKDAGWFSVAEATERLTYDSAKRLLREATTRLERL